MRENNKKEGNILLGVSVVIFFLSAWGIGGTYFSLLGLGNILTGHATTSGEVNVTVLPTLLVNFTTDDNINWGTGSVDSGASFSVLDTLGNVTNGTWVPKSSGFIIKNFGNVNVNLTMANLKDAVAFLGGTNPSYQYMVSNVDDDACTTPVGFTLGIFYNVSLDPAQIVVCEVLSTNSSILLDLRLRVPSNSDLGVLSDTITIGYEEAF